MSNKIICDRNKKSQNIKSILLKKLKGNKIRSKAVIVVGGDGFMLKTLKKNKNSSNLYYGINSGNYGFLMNKFSPKKNNKKFIQSQNDFHLSFGNEGS